MRAASWTAAVLAAFSFVALVVPASGQEKPQEPPKEKPKDEQSTELAKDPPKAALTEPAKESPPAPAKEVPPKDAADDGVDNYRLRTGDQIEVKVFNGNKLTPELAVTLTVPAKGGASLPPIGRIDLIDRTVFDVQESVAQKYMNEGYLAHPNVGCVVVFYEPRLIFLIGAIHGTVTLPVQKTSRILEVLAKAGTLDVTGSGGSNAQTGYSGSGLSGADFSHVRVRRMGSDGRPFTFEVNVDDILERNQEQQNIVMFENDIVIVPQLQGANPQSSDFVYVLGKVHAPGRQPIVKGRTPFTLTKLIALCGDFMDYADRTKVRVIRTTPTGRVPYTIDFDDIISNDRPDFEMQPDDLVYVPENWI